MRIRASLLTFVTVGGLAAAAGCTHPSAKLMVDAPKLLPYQAPDIDEITGIDSEEETPATPATPAARDQK